LITLLKSMGPKLKNFEPLKLTPPSDLVECKISDNLEDSCKTLCKICAKPFNLAAMRSHTLSAHNLQITKYKEIHGQFEILQVVWHRCHICGKLVLMDSDALGGHIKGTHKMKEKEYKEQYCVYKQRSLTPGASENNEVIARKSTLKRKPSEQTQEELARPQKKLKGAILSKGVGMDLERDGSTKDPKVPPQTVEEERTAEESSSSEMEMSFMKQVERMGRITNKRVGALKRESRIFKESVMGNGGVQMLGGNDGAKPPGRPAYKASSSKEGKSRAGLKKNFDPFVDVEYDCNLKDCQDCGKVSLVIRLSQLEMKHIGKGKNLLKDSKVSDKEVSDEELLAEVQNSDRGHENIAEVPVLDELCGGESNTVLKQNEEAEAGEVGRPLCTKQMPLLKETCLYSEVVSPSFDLTTSESESSDDESNSSENDEVDQSVGLQLTTPFNKSKTSETENGEVEIMSGDKSEKGGWKKSGKGFVWARGSSMHNDEVVELQENGNREDAFGEE